MEQTYTQSFLGRTLQVSTRDLAVAGVFGALAIVLSFTPLGLIPVPNISGAATSLHLPAIVAGIVGGPVVGGLVVSQLLTLYITPVVYIYMERFSRWLRRHKLTQAAPEPENVTA